MLINFRVSNFLSFDQLNTFSLEKGKSRRHPNHVYQKKGVNLLKFSAIYGANGAGKSNLIKAFKFSKDFITINELSNNQIKSYCRTNIENKNKETSFEYEIYINNQVFSYGFSIILSKQKITKEWLYLLEKDTEQAIYLIDRPNNIIQIDHDALTKGTNERERLKIYVSDFEHLLKKDDAPLFLHFVNDAKNDFSEFSQAHTINNIYKWFAHKLEVISPTDSTNRGLTYLEEDDDAIEDFLKDFGTGINKIIVEPIELEEIYQIENHKFINFVKSDLEKSLTELKEKANKEVRIAAMMRTENNLFSIHSDEYMNISYKVIKFEHYIDNETYTLNEESDGTIRLLELYDIIKNKKEKIFIVDELDRSLHPNLTFNFIKKYLSTDNVSQLVVSTHEDRILDLNIMRRDEIWFVEKNTEGMSSLYSLEEFKTRFDQDIMNAYLDGRYGSIPKFKFLN